MRADVRRWFDRRSSRAADWPVRLLQEHKGKTTVSVVLPALDEESTVGRIVERIRVDLVERAHLVDELVVMDSGSSDRTAAVAAAAGARVLHRSDVLPDWPPRPGKGEVLWRSLAATSGDVVVFIDADLREFTSAFVTGLLGPLLTDPTVHLVKATYDRPLQRGESLVPAGGGRVTELVARPLLNLHWPALSGFVQPLSGEYAARRALLEQLPFASGYGVEFGLLVDALAVVGLDGLAQVDLVRRKHRNSAQDKLGLMAAEILQVAAARLQRPVGLPATMTQFDRDAEHYRIETTDVTVTERPPMRDVRAHRIAASA